MKIIIPQIAYACFCVLFAYINYVQIEKLNERVRHGINGSIHLVIALYFGITVNWKLGVDMLFIGRVFFDCALNTMRGLGIAYEPLQPKSIVDKVEITIFGMNGIIPKALYVLVIMLLNIILLR